MAMSGVNENIRYEPDEQPPAAIAFGAGVQAVATMLAPVVLTVVIVGRIADQPSSYIAWGIFAALVISGLSTILQAVRVGRIGSGHVLIMGTSGAFIAVCVAALVEGGPALMASLIIVSSLFQFALAARLSLLRRIFTPVVAGTVVMLIAATVMPIVFSMLTETPEGESQTDALITALVTLGVVGVLILRGPAGLRLWSPLLGVVSGSIVAAALGLYDFQPVLDAAWVGAPLGSWPGIDTGLGWSFVALLPAFIVATLAGAIETIGDGVAIQKISRRRPQATDFRLVQGGLYADGVGNLVSGLAGTPPNTTYSSSIALVEVTGIAARRVGVIIGVLFVLLAFFPKVGALLTAIPGPVVGVYVVVIIALLFVQGMRIVLKEHIDHRGAMVIGMSFWVGSAFQNNWVFPELLGDGFLKVLLGNGMTSGALAAILMMVFLELTGRRRRRLSVPLDEEALPKLGDFLRAMGSSAGWSPAAIEGRLVLVGEEALASLIGDSAEADASAPQRRLVVTARMQGAAAELEFVSAPNGADYNIEDRVAYLGDTPDLPEGGDFSFRLLGGFASSVRHQKYHDIDIVSVEVASRSGAPAKPAQNEEGQA